VNKDLVVEIFVPTLGSAGSEGMIATGYPVAPDRILTARHAFFPAEGPARDEGRPIEVRWHYKDADDDWHPAQDIAWESERWDLALLACAFPAPVAANRGVLSAALPSEPMRWKSVGFPRVGGRRDNKRKHFDMQGKVYSMLSTAERFAISEEAGPTTEDDWKGASGAPVFVDWRILGVIVSVPPDLAAMRLEAAPMWRVIKEAPGFRAEMRFDERERRRDAVLAKLHRLLIDSRAASKALALRRPELEERIDGADGNEAKAAKLAAALLDLEVPALIQTCQQAHADLGRDPANDVLTAIVQTVLPAIYDHGVVETVRNACGEVAAELMTLPACYPTVAEIIMAGADRRAAAFCGREREDDFPRGKLNLPAPPECGYDSDGEEAARALDLHLTGKFSWADPERFAELSAAVDSFMTRRFPGPSRPGVTRTPERRVIEAAREIAYQAKALGRTYYLIVPAPVDPDDKAAFAANLAAIRERYKGLMCISLNVDEDAEDAEWTCFRPLLELLPKKGTRP